MRVAFKTKGNPVLTVCTQRHPFSRTRYPGLLHTCYDSCVPKPQATSHPCTAARAPRADTHAHAHNEPQEPTLVPAPAPTPAHAHSDARSDSRAQKCTRPKPPICKLSACKRREENVARRSRPRARPDTRGGSVLCLNAVSNDRIGFGSGIPYSITTSYHHSLSGSYTKGDSGCTSTQSYSNGGVLGGV